MDGKRILTLDETWFGETNYKRKCWFEAQEPPSMINNVFQPRITLIAAVDNFGDAYFSLLQANNNQYTYGEFVKELV